MSHRPAGAAAAREVLLFVGKARTTSSAPPFSRTSSRNASVGRSSPNGLPPSLTVALAQIGRHPSEQPTSGDAAGGSPRPLMTEVQSIRHGSATRGRSGCRVLTFCPMVPVCSPRCSVLDQVVGALVAEVALRPAADSDLDALFEQ